MESKEHIVCTFISNILRLFGFVTKMEQCLMFSTGTRSVCIYFGGLDELMSVHMDVFPVKYIFYFVTFVHIDSLFDLQVFSSVREYTHTD